MNPAEENLGILDKFNFDIKPVGIKFLAKKPISIDRLDKSLTLCEMLKWAQDGHAFYADSNSHTCAAGLYVLGQADLAEPYINGEFGAGLGVFDSTRSASRLYQHISRIDRGVVNYLALAPLDKLDFTPDLLIITSKTSQTEIILRARSYKTGELWVSKYTSALGCSWLFAYPYLTGEINYISTGLGFGMKRRKIFPEGLHLISIPYDKLPGLLQTLREMPWEPAPYGPDGLEYVKKLRIDLGLDPPQPG
jgi:uncharacterized protein (DUF169 family)